MSKHYIKLIGLLAVIFISIIDYLILIDISLSILYLLPISYISWDGKKRFAIFLVLLSTAGWFIAELKAKTDLPFFLLLWNTGVRLIVFFTIAYLLSSLKLAYEKEKNLAQIDGLTGIANQRFFRELLQIESKRSIRYGHIITLAYIDLDNFKKINDGFGHNTGDKLLKLIAQTIKKEIRQTDTIARLGGDEFALLLPETNYEAGQAILFRVQQKLKIAIEAKYPIISFSIGAITFLSLPNSIDQMFEEVDRLMYQVKKSGKNRIEHQLFDQSHLSI